jgi:periplasmic protein CpxP/Spy
MSASRSWGCWLVAFSVGLSLCAWTAAPAQSTSDSTPGAAAGGTRVRAPAGASVAADQDLDSGGGAAGPRRQLLEQRVRLRFEQIVRQRLQLTDDQMRRLRETNEHFAGQRRVLSDRERELRRSIRSELVPGTAANQAHVAALADSLIAVQHQRLDILQAEQLEMAGYLSPVQRVRYYGLQEQLRRRMDQIRQRRQLAQQARPAAGATDSATPAPDSESP